MAFANVSQPFEFKQLANSNTNVLSEFLRPIQAELGDFEASLLELINTSSKTSKKIVEYFFSQKGKRIRPAIFLSLCNSLSYNGRHKNTMACVSEYVHAASLLHDDVVDDSPTRRNRETSHTIWGRPATILVGDLIYARASELMTETGELDIVASFARATYQMSEGEIIQLEHISDLSIPEEVYFKIISYKTASLLSTSCLTAAILAKVNDRQKKALENFGYSLGVSFQLIDDALDYMSEQKLLGKEIFKDFNEGKVTLPLIQVLKKTSKEETKKIHTLFQRNELNPNESQEILGLIQKYKTNEYTVNLAKDYTYKAVKELNEAFDSSYNLDTLKELATRLVERKY